MKVFVLHGSADAWIVRQVARCIPQVGTEILIDAYGVMTADSVSERVFGLLAKADELAVLITPQARHRAWVWPGVGIMRFLGRRIVAVFHGFTKRDMSDSGGDGARPTSWSAS